jgi:hypothetical protein
LVSWGNLLWSQGAYGQARRKFNAALALLVDVDDTLAEHVRDLLRQPTQSHRTHDELDAERTPYGRHEVTAVGSPTSRTTCSTTNPRRGEDQWPNSVSKQ